MSDAGLDAAAARAVEIAKAGAAVARVRFGEAPTAAYEDSFVTPVENDPASVQLDKRVALLLDAEKALHATPKVRAGRAWIELWRTDKEFHSTIGSRIAQSIVQIGLGDDGARGRRRRRTRPLVSRRQRALSNRRLGDRRSRATARERSADRRGGTASSSTRRNARAARWTSSSAARKSRCRSTSRAGIRPNSTASWAGRRISRGRASSTQNCSARSSTAPRKSRSSSTTACRAGLRPWATTTRAARASASDIIRAGILAGFEMSRDTARTIGRATNACVRAQSWQHVPMIRMCNLNLLPGRRPVRGALRRRQARHLHGINRSWSIDDHRLNFQFGCQIGWEIVNGKRGRIVKNPTYAGVTPRVLELVRRDRRRAVVARVGDAATAVRASRCRQGAPRRRARRRASATSASGSVTMTSAEREALAKRALALASDGAQGEFEVLVFDEDRGLTRFTHDTVHQNLAALDTTVRIRADHRRAHRRRIDQPARRRVAPQDRRRARPQWPRTRPAIRPSPDYRRPPRRAPRRPTHSSKRPRSAGPDKRAAIAGDIFETAERDGLWAAGYVTTSRHGITVANSRGTLARFRQIRIARLNVKHERRRLNRLRRAVLDRRQRPRRARLGRDRRNESSPPAPRQSPSIPVDVDGDPRAGRVRRTARVSRGSLLGAGVR